MRSGCWRKVAVRKSSPIAAASTRTSTRLKECLSRNRDVLSQQCQSDYFGAFDAIQKRVAARVTVANACQREIVKVCGGSTKETSKAVPCLISTPKGISNNCLKAVDDAGYR